MQPETLMFAPEGQTFGHPDYPALLYRGVLTGSAEDSEALVDRNGWPAQWRGGIFTYHHYHSTAHEALGVISGRARVVLGGPEGQEVSIRAGDLAVLPAGTGHCLLEESDDFEIFGAYPAGQQNWDICRKSPDAETLQRIRAVPLPESDPLTGGSMSELWS